MHYLMLIIGFPVTEGSGQQVGTPSVEEFMTYDQAIRGSGVYVDGNALHGTEVATSIQVNADGKTVVTDGPFPENSEFVGGYYLIDVPDLETALDWAERCPGAKYGRIEVRQVVTF